MGWHHGDPVVGVGLLIVVVIRVVEQLVRVVVGVDLRFWVQVPIHLGVSISVSQLRVVVERNSCEGVEVVWVHRLGLGHGFLVGDSLFFGGTSGPLRVEEVDRAEEGGVEGEVGGVTHPSESGECI